MNEISRPPRESKIVKVENGDVNLKPRRRYFINKSKKNAEETKALNVENNKALELNVY